MKNKNGIQWKPSELELAVSGSAKQKPKQSTCLGFFYFLRMCRSRVRPAVPPPRLRACRQSLQSNVVGITMKRRSATPWKKSRTYGDIHGGRTRRRMADNIFARAHSLQRPGVDEPLPILIQENPSREFFFPAAAQEFAEVLARLPQSHRDGITHIWLRRMPAKARRERAPLAEFICGSGVRVIVIYPWPVDETLCLGRAKPAEQEIALYRRFGGTVLSERGHWRIRLPASELRRFYVEHLFCHEVGHHVDWYNRRWSKANARQVEGFADQYAVQWGPSATALVVEPGGALSLATKSAGIPS